MVSLGCDKNLVDSEEMLAILADHGYVITDDETEADCAVINTCCFIEDAKKESIEEILALADLKETANLKVLVVTGCMAQRYKEEILKEKKSLEKRLSMIESMIKGEIPDPETMRNVLKEESVE